ncbi:RadC family protein [Pseudoalteromonas denitrificans]|uniref:DNA replication and repair protein RadC n=1 Tax=Pseudoalteromonas denitrificans DSM 6059 TaxID=1123010 RepID=A0A1I1JXT7_9GAMM|nr:DNA repair protein RadC [Pseudoalteromonas denitrificans]SFC52792.1 DNA replication and repair protein RadC [Pseudoalteromonas denitrificans DSM 6059]
MQLSAMSKMSRPREKLLEKGAPALVDAELLAIFLRTGIPGMNAIELAQHLLDSSGSLQNLFNAPLNEFIKFKGLGNAKYAQLQAVLELNKRYLAEQCQQQTLFNSPKAVRDFLSLKLKAHQQEVFMLLYLDSQNRLLQDEILFYGTINAANVYPREVVKSVLKNNAAAVILAHNHPSGIAEPSQADRLITDKLIQALNLIDVQILDHLVIASDKTVSFAERGWL